MKSYLKQLAALVALAFAFLPALPADAQTVTKQPYFVGNQAWLDLGNGPAEIHLSQGNGDLYTSVGSGLGSTSGASTTLTLTATAAGDPPCVGCIISGTGTTSGTTVTAFNGTTGITLSAAMTVASNTPLSWGVACPASGAPTQSYLSAPLDMRAAASGPRGAAFPMYTQGRLCAYGAQQGGATLLEFAIGAW